VGKVSDASDTSDAVTPVHHQRGTVNRQSINGQPGRAPGRGDGPHARSLRAFGWIVGNDNNSRTAVVLDQNTPTCGSFQNPMGACSPRQRVVAVDALIEPMGQRPCRHPSTGQVQPLFSPWTGWILQGVVDNSEGTTMIDGCCRFSTFIAEAFCTLPAFPIWRQRLCGILNIASIVTP